jgi:hypothetical protein
MGGEKIKLCSCVDCPIYEYRAAVTGHLHVDFLPVKPTIRDVLTHSNQKDVKTYGNGKQAPQNAVIQAREAV